MLRIAVSPRWHRRAIPESNIHNKINGLGIKKQSNGRSRGFRLVVFGGSHASRASPGRHGLNWPPELFWWRKMAVAEKWRLQICREKVPDGFESVTTPQ